MDFTIRVLSYDPKGTRYLLKSAVTVPGTVTGGLKIGRCPYFPLFSDDDNFQAGETPFPIWDWIQEKMKENRSKG